MIKRKKKEPLYVATELMRYHARQEILLEANRFKLAEGTFNNRLYKRHINQAVRICRANGLVSDQTLIDAGFNPVNKPGEHTENKLTVKR